MTAPGPQGPQGPPTNGAEIFLADERSDLIGVGRQMHAVVRLFSRQGWRARSRPRRGFDLVNGVWRIRHDGDQVRHARPYVLHRAGVRIGRFATLADAVDGSYEAAGLSRVMQWAVSMNMTARLQPDGRLRLSGLPSPAYLTRADIRPPGDVLTSHGYAARVRHYVEYDQMTSSDADATAMADVARRLQDMSDDDLRARVRISLITDTGGAIRDVLEPRLIFQIQQEMIRRGLIPPDDRR